MNIKFSVFILILLSFFMFNCAGTRKKSEPDKTNAAATQEKDLTDIEALLGIDTNQPAKKPATKKKKKDKLNLLNENEVVSPGQGNAAHGLSSREKREYERRIKNLQQQLRDKDQIIQQLKDQLNQQSLEITRLKSKKESAATYSSTPTAAPVGTVSGSEYEATYQKARAAFEARDYQTALSLFQSLIASNPNHPLADNAQYWIGECHYALKKYDAAIMDFQKVFTFPNSNKMADAQFKLVLCYLRKGEVEKAREEFQRLRSEFPNSPYVSRAEAILAKY